MRWPRAPRLALRSRLALLCAAAVALGLVGASVTAWLVTRQTMREQIDRSLGVPAVVRDTLSLSDQPPEGGPTIRIPDDLAEQIPERLCADLPVQTEDGENLLATLQVILDDGTVCAPGSDDLLIDPTDAERAIAETGDGEIVRDATDLDGNHVRVLTRPLADGAAIQTVRSLEEVDATTTRLAWILLAVCVLGSLLAAFAGRAATRYVLRPVERLTAAAEHVAATDDLDLPLARTVDDGAAPIDEVSRLTGAFDAMIARLATSRRRQQQLVADASHELRTPVTSLRTNVEWLMRSDDAGRPLVGEERRTVERAVLGQVDELAHLVGELAELARAGSAPGPDALAVPVDLGEVALAAVERAQRRDPGRRFDVDLVAAPTTGESAALERAVLNLLDNALKFSTGPIEVVVRPGRVAVLDRGPGLAEPDRAHAFDRFWRAAAARELPGSGLGLAIVDQVARRHGGEPFFSGRAGGGSEVGFSVQPSA